MSRLTKDSVKLSFYLRHAPEQLKLEMDSQGYVLVDQLLANAEASGWGLTELKLNEIVGTDLKQRYSFSADREYIRANQGHSTQKVKLTLVKVVPPVVLYHGTSSKSIDEIKKHGLLPMKRHHVHLSADLATALNVAKRHGGNPIIVHVDVKTMLKDGRIFYISENNIYLTDSVPVKYLSYAE